MRTSKQVFAGSILIAVAALLGGGGGCDGLSLPGGVGGSGGSDAAGVGGGGGQQSNEAIMLEYLNDEFPAGGVTCIGVIDCANKCKAGSKYCVEHAEHP